MSYPETTLIGSPTAPGIAIGEVFLYHHDTPSYRVASVAADDVDRELKRLREALALTRRQITALRDRFAGQAGETAARIFDAQVLICDDVEFIGQMEGIISGELLNAEPVVEQVAAEWRDRLAALEGTLFHQRAQDVVDIGRRIIRNLLGRGDGLLFPVETPCIIVADDLLPSDVIHLMRENVLAVATDLGGAASHTAILTKTLEVPAVIGLKTITNIAESGNRIIVNGNSGKVIVRPSLEKLSEYSLKRERYQSFVTSLKDIRSLPAETLDGHRILLKANIELPQEVERAVAHGGDGIGLFRSEYLLLSQGNLPTEDEQFRDYRKVLEAASPRPVTIRTFDIGGDKLFPDVPHPLEANPFMGWRAIRVGLSHPQLFKTQIRAILRAAVYGEARIMIPLVMGLDDLLTAKEMIAEVHDELHRASIDFNPSVPVGIMIELPSAVLLAGRLAMEADFFSIGTNDLTQFALAVDRGNEMVREYYQPLHPALVRLISQTIAAGKIAGIEVGMCGELAAAPLATMLLIGLGITELSMSPVYIPEIKKLIRSMRLSDARHLAELALVEYSSRNLVEILADENKRRFRDLPIWFNEV